MRINGARLGSVALLALVGAGMSPARAQAQGTIGYVLGGPVLVRNIGAHNSAWQIGGGGELLNGPLGLGGGIDYVYFPEASRIFDGGRGGSSSPANSAASSSANASYYFGGTVIARRIRPFMSAGITYLVDPEPYPMLHVSGGFDWWATRRTGFRVEVREQLAGMLVIRCGVVFR
jgi:hypothetical protein